MRLLILFVMTIGSIEAQDFSNYLWDQYSKYRERSLSHRRFKHDDLIPLMEKLSAGSFQVSEAGQSYLGKPIYTISIGTGPTKVLLWSQMHGNEATATMALFDMFNFLNQADIPQVQEILSRLTLYAVPMLNPDGAELFQRRTVQGIDMNRDALNLTCPESQVLKSLRDSIEADWGFNLHDQNIYYNVGQTEKPATISFLAPAYNEAKEVNHQRADAMKLIAVMNQALQQVIPGQVGKYDDTFEPRAFGDNIQKWGTRTILIESGGLAGDPEKQIIRKLNFMAILTALSNIASSSYHNYDLQQYWDIPMNSSNLNDLLIRKVTVSSQQGPAYEVDIAIRREEYDRKGKAPLFYKGTIEDLGDLSTQYGYQEIDGKGLTFAAGKVYEEGVGDLTTLDADWVNDLLKQGYTSLKFESEFEFEFEFEQDSYGLPFDVVGDGFKHKDTPKIEQSASFLLVGNNEVRYVVINGFIYDVNNIKKPLGNGWVHK
jgi:hypothetical protein